jgi:predicted TIM-barrel fold metal-dependent hydrolase
MSNWIDAHVHLWTDDRQRYPRTDARPVPPDRFHPEDLFAHAKPAGVARTVLIQMSFYRFDNSYMLDCLRAHPGVFSAVAIVDSTAEHPDRAMKELKRRGARGFRIVPGNASQTWLDTPGMQAMWRCGAEERLAMCPLINPDALASVDRMCDRFPDTPVVIDHLARIGAAGPVRDEDLRALSALARHKNVSIKVSAFYALGKKAAPYTDLVPMIRRVFEDFGPRRLMWASDAPFQVQPPHTYAASLALVQQGLPFLSRDDREWLLRKTAESVFFR